MSTPAAPKKTYPPSQLRLQPSRHARSKHTHTHASNTPGNLRSRYVVVIDDERYDDDNIIDDDDDDETFKSLHNKNGSRYKRVTEFDDDDDNADDDDDVVVKSRNVYDDKHSTYARDKAARKPNRHGDDDDDHDDNKNDDGDEKLARLTDRIARRSTQNNHDDSKAHDVTNDVIGSSSRHFADGERKTRRHNDSNDDTEDVLGDDDVIMPLRRKFSVPVKSRRSTVYEAKGNNGRSGLFPLDRLNTRYKAYEEDNALLQSLPQGSSPKRDPAPAHVSPNQTRGRRSVLREFERDLDEAIVTDSQFIAMLLQESTRLSREVRDWSYEYSLDDENVTSLAKKLMKGDFRHLYADLPPEDRVAVEDDIGRMRDMTFEELLQSIATYD